MTSSNGICRRLVSLLYVLAVHVGVCTSVAAGVSHHTQEFSNKTKLQRHKATTNLLLQY